MPSARRGIPRSVFNELLPEAARALDRLRQVRASPERLSLPRLCRRARRSRCAGGRWLAIGAGATARLVVLGTGGASLGGQALAAIGPESERLLVLDKRQRRPPLDRVLLRTGARHHRLPGRLEVGAPPRRPSRRRCSCWTLLSPRALLPSSPSRARAPCAAWPARFGPAGPLDHDPALGGRFSALSLVGLLPAMFAGVSTARPPVTVHGR